MKGRGRARAKRGPSDDQGGSRSVESMYGRREELNERTNVGNEGMNRASRDVKLRYLWKVIRIG